MIFFLCPLNRYKDNIIIQTILLPSYFEPITISKFGPETSSSLTGYLNNCCQNILALLEYYNYEGKDFGPHKEDYEGESLENGIRNELENFVNYIVRKSQAVSYLMAMEGLSLLIGFLSKSWLRTRSLLRLSRESDKTLILDIKSS